MPFWSNFYQFRWEVVPSTSFSLEHWAFFFCFASVLNSQHSKHCIITLFSQCSTVFFCKSWESEYAVFNKLCTAVWVINFPETFCCRLCDPVGEHLILTTFIGCAGREGDGSEFIEKPGNCTISVNIYTHLMFAVCLKFWESVLIKSFNFHWASQVVSIVVKLLLQAALSPPCMRKTNQIWPQVVERSWICRDKGK